MQHFRFDVFGSSRISAFQSSYADAFLCSPSSSVLFTALQACQVAADYINVFSLFKGEVLFVRKCSPLTSFHSYALVFLQCSPFASIDSFGHDVDDFVSRCLPQLGFYLVSRSCLFNRKSISFAGAYAYFRELLNV